MRFDASGLYSAFDRMQENASAKGKDLATVQANDFLSEMKKDGRAIAPTPETLKGVAEKLGWRLRRKKGVSPEKELQRRIRARGTFARFWKIWKTDSEKFRIRIWLIDDGADSAKVDAQKGVSEKAVNASGGRFKSRLNKLADAVTKF